MVRKDVGGIDTHLVVASTLEPHYLNKHVRWLLDAGFWFPVDLINSCSRLSLLLATKAESTRFYSLHKFDRISPIAAIEFPR